MGFSAPVAAAAGVVGFLALAQPPVPQLVSFAAVPPSPARAGEGRVGVAQRVEAVSVAIAEPTPPNPPLKAGEGDGKTETPPQITIKPGNSLWALSREIYGAGRNYLTLLNANKDKIADPKLIYPGQVLAAPKQMEN